MPSAKGPRRTDIITEECMFFLYTLYINFHVGKALLNSRTVQGLPRDTPFRFIQARLCSIQELFKDCHDIQFKIHTGMLCIFQELFKDCQDIHQGSYRQGLWNQISFQGLPGDASRFTQERLCNIQQTFQGLSTKRYRQGYLGRNFFTNPPTVIFRKVGKK